MPNFIVVVMLISNISCQVFILTIVLILVHLFGKVDSSSWLPSKKLLLEEELCRTQNRRHKRDLFGITGFREFHIANARQAKPHIVHEHKPHKPKHLRAVPNKPSFTTETEVSKFPICYTLSSRPTTVTTTKKPVVTTQPRTYSFPLCYTFSRKPTIATTSSTKTTTPKTFSIESATLSTQPTKFPIRPTNLLTTSEYTSVAPPSTQDEVSSTLTVTSEFPMRNSFPSTPYTTTNFPMGPSNLSPSTEFTQAFSSSTESVFSSMSITVTKFPMGPSNLLTSTESTQPFSFSPESLFSSTSNIVTNVPLGPSNLQSSTDYTQVISSSTQFTLSRTESDTSTILFTTTTFPGGLSLFQTTPEYTSVTSSPLSNPFTLSSTESDISSILYITTNFRIGPSNPPFSTDYTQVSSSSAQSEISSTFYASTNFPGGRSFTPTTFEYTTVSSSSLDTQSTLPSTQSYISEYSIALSSSTGDTISSTQSTLPSTESDVSKTSTSSTLPSNPSAVTNFPVLPSNLLPSTTEYTSSLSFNTDDTISSTLFTLSSTQSQNSQFPSIPLTTTNFLMGPSNPQSTIEYTTFFSFSPQTVFSSSQFLSSPSTITMEATSSNMFGSTNLPNKPSHMFTTDYVTSLFFTTSNTYSSDYSQMSTSKQILSQTTDFMNRGSTLSSTTEQTLYPNTFTEETTTESSLFTIPMPTSYPIMHTSSENIWQTFSTTESPFSTDIDLPSYSTTEMPFPFRSTIYTTESTPISSEFTEYSITEPPLSTESHASFPLNPSSGPFIFGPTNMPLQEMTTTAQFTPPTTEYTTTGESTTEDTTTAELTTEETMVDNTTTKETTTAEPTIEKTTTKETTATKQTTKKPATTKPTTAEPTTKPPSECPKHDTNTKLDKCACFSDNHCRIDEHGHKCLADYEICQRYHPDPDKECIRTPTGEQAEVFYIYAGTPCPRYKLHRRKRAINFLRRYRVGSLVTIDKEDGNHSHASSPHCKVEETLLAVNLGRDQKHVDGYGIQYMADNEVPWIDPNNTRKNDISLHLNGVDKKDMWLYRWQIWGDWEKKGIGHCVIYEVPLGKDGQHELNMKMIDNYWGRKGTRGFNVRFNGITILPEIDLIHTTGKQFRAVDMILNFEVTRHGKQLIMAGYPNSEIHDGFVELKFCYGECNSTDEDYHVAGFSVVRFAKPEDLTKESDCNQFRRLPCLCKQQGCQYNMETGDCRIQEECPSRMFRHNECKRVNAFYSNGGVLCQNPRGGGSCIVAETIKAINFHGEATDDRRTGITYQSDRNIEIGRLIDFAPKCSEVNTKARELYCFYTEASLDTLTREHCLEYNMPIVKDGSYELSFKMGEFRFNNRGDRTFNIKLNGEVILKELDILAVVEKNKAIDVNILFEVLDEGGIVWMKGYSLRRIDGEIKLQFCNGEWSKKDGSWILSAFSVVRFEYPFRNTSAYTFSA